VIRLYFFDGGSVTQPLWTYRLGPASVGDNITVPIPWFLIMHPRGNVVVDGGNAPEVAVDARAHWGAFLDVASVSMRPDQTVIPSLASVGVDPKTIRWVIQSHLHMDHTGALAVIEQLPKAQVLATGTEFRFAHAAESFVALGYCKADFAKEGVDWVLLEDGDDGYDLFGDGSIRCWTTPGHTPGHQSIEVNLSSGATYLLAGDAASSVGHLEEKVPPVLLVDAVQTVQSFRKLRRLAWRAEATVVTGHDPEQWPMFAKAPDFHE
jgi:glyoxylase-like metal-dependent hydrolase (beta-lactamase superfamily II)